MAESMTAEEFLQCRFELPDAGQWSELEAGNVVHLQPPDLDHGTVVLNLSKAFAEHLQSADRGYACFDLGLQLRSDPDTVRFPAACFFEAGPRFAESDRQLTIAVPALVVELASTPDRRRLQPLRSVQFLEWGVKSVWTIDPQKQTVDVFRSPQSVHTVTSAERLSDDAVLPEFRILVSSLFAEPSWWNPKRSPGR